MNNNISTSTVHVTTRKENQHKEILIEVDGELYPIKSITVTNDKIIISGGILK